MFASPQPGLQEGTTVKGAVAEGDIPPKWREVAWYTLFDSAVDGHSPEAQSADDGVHWYHVRLKVAPSCADQPSSDNDTFNAFKVRTTGQLRLSDEAG